MFDNGTIFFTKYSRIKFKMHLFKFSKDWKKLKHCWGRSEDVAEGGAGGCHADLY